MQQYHPAPVTWSLNQWLIVVIDRVGRTPGPRAAAERRRYQIVFITAPIAIAYKKDVECVNHIYFFLSFTYPFTVMAEYKQPIGVQPRVCVYLAS